MAFIPGVVAAVVIGKKIYDFFSNDQRTANNVNADCSFSDHVLKAEKTMYINPVEVKEFKESIEKKFLYDKEGKIEVTSDMIENGLKVNEGELCFKEVADDNLDNEDIDNMVAAAKHGMFSKVWDILDKKPYLVNCIPEERAWSVLHQAIYHGNLDAVKKLVEIYGADIGVRTKIDRAKDTKPGTDALSLAKERGQTQIYDYMLKYAVLSKKLINGQDISFFVTHINGNVYPFKKYPLFQITLASYTHTFLQTHHSHINQAEHVAQIVKDILSRTDSTWQRAKDKIRHTLYGIDRGKSEYLLGSKSKEELFERIIKLYTEESIYHHLTPALIRQPKKPYMPLAVDLAVGPFALILSAILLYWNGLDAFSGTTYRGVPENVADKYKVGETLLFSSFVSSSKLDTVAKHFSGSSGTLFIFDNSVSSRWQPRSIKKYSRYPSEEECLFPLGIELRVMSVDKFTYPFQVHLKLLDPSI